MRLIHIIAELEVGLHFQFRESIHVLSLDAYRDELGVKELSFSICRITLLTTILSTAQFKCRFYGHVAD